MYVSSSTRIHIRAINEICRHVRNVLPIVMVLIIVCYSLCMKVKVMHMCKAIRGKAPYFREFLKFRETHRFCSRGIFLSY
jgi:type II secretory pathway component PulF